LVADDELASAHRQIADVLDDVLDENVEEKEEKDDDPPNVVEFREEIPKYRYILNNSLLQNFASVIPTLKPVDCLGSPWCGPTAVYMALGKDHNWLRENINLLVGDAPFGHSLRSLGKLVNRKGLDLVVVGEDLNIIYVTNLPGSCGFICLKAIGGDGIHHALLMGQPTVDNDSVLNFSNIWIERGIRWFKYRVCLNHYNLIRYVTYGDMRDVRSVVEKRDPIEVHEKFALMEKSTIRQLQIFGRLIFCSSWFSWLTGCKSKLVRVGIEAAKLWAIEIRAASKFMDMTQFALRRTTMIGRDPLTTDYSQTVEFLKDTTVDNTAESIAPLISYVDPGANALFPDPDLIVGSSLNEVVRYKHQETRIRKAAICDYPVVTSQGVLGAGRINATDAETVLVAFTGRSMKPEPFYSDKLDKFLKFSFGVVDRLVLEMDSAGLVEQPCDVAYRRLMRGKKTQSYIGKQIEGWEKALRGEHKYKRHSCFVKCESNVKSGKSKPRLIMTMSPYHAVSCCQILDVLERLVNTSFNDRAIKHKTTDQIMSQLAEVCDGPHMVTDYSSWEASMTPHIRKIENRIMSKALMKCGFTETWRSMRSLCFGQNRGRVLEYGGSQYRIYTRCSGDYWTSFGNGLINLCLSWFMTNPDVNYHFKAVFEGDDGVISRPPSDIVESSAELGFSLGTSVKGTRLGDTDFLQVRYCDGKKFLNVHKFLKSVWLKKAQNLGENKRGYLYQCVAASLYHLSPGHPVTTELANSLFRLGVKMQAKKFRNFKRYLNTYDDRRLNYDFSSVSWPAGVDETMRKHVADGAVGFTPIPIESQLWLEQQLRSSQTIVYVGSILCEDKTFMDMVESNDLLVEPRRDIQRFRDFVVSMRLTDDPLSIR